MAITAMSDEQDRNKDARGRRHRSEMHRRQRGKNIALAVALAALMALFYVVAIVRMSGG